MTPLIGRGIDREERAVRSGGAWLLLLMVLAIGLTADLATKTWAFATVADEPVTLDRVELLEEPDRNPIPYHSTRTLLPGDLLGFTLVVNRGAVFGIAEHQRGLLVAFTVIALGAGVLIFGFSTRRRDRVAHVAIAFVLAGGLGNLHDRIAYAAVRDFIKLMPGKRLPFEWRWPGNNPEMLPWVFNIADMLLVFGMVLLVVHINSGGRHPNPAAAPKPAPEG